MHGIWSELMETDSDRYINEKIRHFIDLKNKSVLEVGCGNGRITEWLRDQPERLVAVDPDSAAITEARNKIGGVEFLVGTGERLAFMADSFDLAVFTLSLHHQRPDKALAEAYRVIKPGGSVVVIEPTVDGEYEAVYAQLNDETAAKQNAQQAIETSSFRIDAVEHFHGNWVFDDKEEMLQSLFDYYEKPFDRSTAEKIETLLGDKIDDQPLVLLDTMIIQHLKKPADAD